MDFSLIITTYKDAPHVERNTLALCDYLGTTNWRWEIVFVEDCSPDETPAAVRRTIDSLTTRGVTVQSIFHEKNTGRGRAVTDGMMIARGDVVGFIDIDLEHLMDGLIPMIRKIQRQEADVVVGRRCIANPAAKPVRVLSSHVYRWLAHILLPLPINDTECGLKVFRREAILPIAGETQDAHWFWDTEVVHRAWRRGLKMAEHLIVFYEDNAKASTVRLIPDVIAYLKAIHRYRKSLRS